MIFAPEESQNKRLTFVATHVVCSSNASISVEITRTTFGAAAASGILGVVAVWTNFAVRFLVCSGYSVKFAWDTTFAFGVGGASCYVVVLAGGTFKARGRIFGTDGLAKFSDRAMLALILGDAVGIFSRRTQLARASAAALAKCTAALSNSNIAHGPCAVENANVRTASAWVGIW